MPIEMPKESLCKTLSKSDDGPRGNFSIKEPVPGRCSLIGEV